MKALALFSGGLDSLLAIKLIQEAGVEVEAIHFLLPFIDEDAEKAIRHELSSLAGQLGVDVLYERVGEDYMDILEKPKYGFGKAHNPCLDCHIYFLNRAKALMKERGASFIVTGEVVGQRPKSQNAGAFPKIDEDTGLTGLIVRPLSVKVLPQTIPEEKGWVNLDHCPNIEGRQRTVQMELAKKHQLRFHPPGGGCQLTYKEFGQKVADLLKYHKNPYHAMRLLTVGRHFRGPEGFKFIIGRDEKENVKLMRYFLRRRKKETLLLFKAGRVPGPICLGLGVPSSSDQRLAATIAARYADGVPGTKITVRFVDNLAAKTLEDVIVNKEETYKAYRIG